MVTSVTLALVALVASISLVAGILLRLTFPAHSWGMGLSRLGALVFGATLSILTIDESFVQLGPSIEGPREIPGVLLGVSLAVAALASFFLSAHAWWRPGVSVRRQPILWGLLVVTLGMSGWSTWLLKRATAPVELLAMNRLEAGSLHEVPDVFGETDLGRRVELLWFDSPSIESYQTVDAIPNRHGGMKRAQPSDQSNCHGWVFTGGQHVVSGDMVPIILEDNGYEAVAEPRAGDLIVYFDDQDFVTHTGIVRGTLDDGVVIIESKFGVGARFLHMPEDQPYSARYEYYRTSRGGHLITVRNSNRKGEHLRARAGRRNMANA